MTLSLEIGIQIAIVFVGGHAFSVTRINGMLWGISIALGCGAIPLGFLIRCIPNPPVERFFYKIGLMHEESALPTKRPNVTDDGENKSGIRRALSKLRIWRRRDGDVVLSRSTTLDGTTIDGRSFTSKMTAI